ncbi:MAG: chemotaxis-specific protein-glutamate methyltransferase CheB [Candidatus Thermoplasmatota archaeon]
MSIRALVVDDSALMRKLISDILRTDPAIQVVDTARDGQEAVEKTLRLQPDVITMDVEMPNMNGIDAVKYIMEKQPTPIVMLSAITTQGAEVTLDALHAGAVDFIPKPSGSISTDIATIGTDIIAKVKQAAATKHKFKKPLLSLSYTKPKINVLLVDDSYFFAKTLTDLINREPDLHVIDYAQNGQEAIEKVQKSHPDVIIMDIDMPVMSGVDATFNILKQQPIPIIICSSRTKEGMNDVKLALELGAIDFIPKPTENMSMHSVAPLLIRRIREAVRQTPKKTEANTISTTTEKILLIGTSTGGPQTLASLIPQIPGDIPAGILIVQHMPPVFTKSLADRLDKISQIRVKEAAEGDEILPGKALLAPGDFHMTVYEKTVNGIKKRFVSLNKEERIHGVRPAVDITFASAANVFGANTIGVILTGMGQDGAHSMGLIKAKGGKTIAQDESTSIIFGMPDAAIKLGVVDSVLPLDQIPAQINAYLKLMTKPKIMEAV